MVRQAQDIFRAIPGGAAIANQSNIITVYAHETDAALESNIDTDANGMWSFTFVPTGSAAAGWVLDPGPIYWVGVYSGNTRKGSSLSGPLAGPNSVLEMHYALQVFGNGVILDALAGNFAVTDAGGVVVSVAAGKYLLDGIQITNPSSRSVNSAAGDATHPRIDRIILEMTRTIGTTFGKTTLKRLAGTPAASPTAPSLTNNASTIQKSLAQVRVNAGASTIASITDERDYTLTDVERSPVIETVARSNAGAAALNTTAATLSDLTHTPTLLDGIRYQILIEAEIHVDGAVSVAQLSPYIGSTVDLADYQSAPPQAGIVLLPNAHEMEVLGTGVPVTVGVLAKRSGTSNVVNWYSGVSRMIAIPQD